MHVLMYFIKRFYRNPNHDLNVQTTVRCFKARDGNGWQVTQQQQHSSILAWWWRAPGYIVFIAVVVVCAPVAAAAPM